MMAWGDLLSEDGRDSSRNRESHVGRYQSDGQIPAGPP